MSEAKRQKAIWRARQKATQKLLWEEWDPIGVRLLGGPSDEYDQYADKVLSMYAAGKPPDAIANYLIWVAEVHMGLGPASDSSREYEIAGKIAGLLN